MIKKEEIKKAIKNGYAKIAKKDSSCCEYAESICGGIDIAKDIGRKIGYKEEELAAVPKGANLGLGCGNPVALASLKKGEIVIDLGSGAGFDCLLAAQRVGKKGKVIGVDMTPEMIEKARENAKKAGYENVEFRFGEIENLPIADNYCDVIISNCVINLSPDKRKVFAEAFRVLKPNGRFIIADIVLLNELPDFIKNSINAYIGCLSGAIMKDQYIRIIKETGFQDVKILDETYFPIECMINDPTAKAIMDNMKMPIEKIREIENIVISIKISGFKPSKRHLSL